MTLYAWPTAAQVGRVVPKERLYSEASASTALKQQFVDQVQQVRWAYKLSEQTTRLKPTDAVREIQIFEVDLKGRDLSETVLTAIDRSIPSAVIFEVTRGEPAVHEVRAVAALKTPGVRGPRLSGYFWGNWTPAATERSALPAAIDLAALYSGLLASLLPVSLRPGENLSDGIGRIARIGTLEREISALAQRMGREPQLNRKVELRHDLKAKRIELAELTDGAERT